MDSLRDLIQYVPFVGLAVSPAIATGKQAQPIITKLAEAAILGAVVMYGTVKLQEGAIAGLKDDVEEIKTDIRTIRNDFYAPRLGRD